MNASQAVCLWQVARAARLSRPVTAETLGGGVEDPPIYVPGELLLRAALITTLGKALPSHGIGLGSSGGVKGKATAPSRPKRAPVAGKRKDARHCGPSPIMYPTPSRKNRHAVPGAHSKSKVVKGGSHSPAGERGKGHKGGVRNPLRACAPAPRRRPTSAGPVRGRAAPAKRRSASAPGIRSGPARVRISSIRAIRRSLKLSWLGGPPPWSKERGSLRLVPTGRLCQGRRGAACALAASGPPVPGAARSQWRSAGRECVLQRSRVLGPIPSVLMATVLPTLVTASHMEPAQEDCPLSICVATLVAVLVGVAIWLLADVVSNSAAAKPTRQQAGRQKLLLDSDSDDEAPSQVPLHRARLLGGGRPGAPKGKTVPASLGDRRPVSPKMGPVVTGGRGQKGTGRRPVGTWAAAPVRAAHPTGGVRWADVEVWPSDEDESMAAKAATELPGPAAAAAGTGLQPAHDPDHVADEEEEDEDDAWGEWRAQGRPAPAAAGPEWRPTIQPISAQSQLIHVATHQHFPAGDTQQWWAQGPAGEQMATQAQSNWTWAQLHMQAAAGFTQSGLGAPAALHMAACARMVGIQPPPRPTDLLGEVVFSQPPPLGHPAGAFFAQAGKGSL